MTTDENDRTEEKEEEGSSLRRSLPVTRRDVMRAAGASGVLAGYAGTAAAQDEPLPDCGCQDITANESQCFTEPAEEDCSYCKIDPIPANGDSCTISGTDGPVTLTITQNSECVRVDDPLGEVGSLALKSGRGCECTVYETVEDGAELCTRLNEDGTGDRCGKDISHISIEICPPDVPVPSGEELTCTTAKVDVTNVDAITLEVEFHDEECDTYVQTFTDGGPNDDDPDTNEISASIDLTAQARCYCTPSVMNVYNGDSTSGDDLITSVDGPVAGFCEPELEAQATCEEVTATATFPSGMPQSEQDELLAGDDDTEGCPITATLHTDCDEMVDKVFPTDAVRLNSTTLEVTWTVGTDYSCYCTPTQVTYNNDSSGATLSDQNDSFSLTSCRPDPDIDATCTSVDVSVPNGLEGCPITATLQFGDCADSDPLTLSSGNGNGFSDSFEVPCYCTPESVTLEWTLLDGTTQSMTADATPSESDLPCAADVDVKFACDVVSFSGTTVPNCDVMVELDVDCDGDGTADATVSKTPTADGSGNVSGEFDMDALGLCYCTPVAARIYEVLPDGSTNLVETETAPTDLDCTPDPDVDATCTEVKVSVPNGLKGCPIDATLSFVNEAGCPDSSPVRLEGGKDFMATIPVPCYCTPESVTLEWTADGTTQSITEDATPTEGDGPCEADVMVTPDCEVLSVSGSTVPGCDVEVEINFHEGGCDPISEPFTGSDTDGSVSGSIDLEAEGRCYCTPESYTVYELRDGSRVRTIGPTPFEAPFDSAEHCEPVFDAEFTCDKVTVEAQSGLIEGCPVTATLYFESDCAEPRTTTLSTSMTSDEFDIRDLCGCPPDRVEFTDEESGRLLQTETAPDLVCECTEFTEVCRIDESEIGALCSGTDVTVDCGDRGTITFEAADVECDGGEVICFNFTSTFKVFKVFVKGGGGRDAGNEYIWSCGTCDSDDPEPNEINLLTDLQEYEGKLCSNFNPNNEQQTAVSHVEFYVCTDESLNGDCPTSS